MPDFIGDRSDDNEDGNPFCSGYETFSIEIDGVPDKIQASSLAQVCNEIRGKGKRMKIWSRPGVLLVDTKFGDAYGLVPDF